MAKVVDVRFRDGGKPFKPLKFGGKFVRAKEN